MGKSGRFGKYGEQKRKERLRQSRTGGMGCGPSGRHPGSDAFPYDKRPHRKGRIVVRPAEVSDAEFIQNLSRKAFRQYGPYEELLPAWFLSGIGAAFEYAAFYSFPVEPLTHTVPFYYHKRRFLYIFICGKALATF